MDDDLDLTAIGARIRAARARAGRTQGQLADATGISQETISRYENGHMEPGLAQLKKIALSLGESFGWLASGEEAVSRPSIESPEAYHEFVADFGHMFDPDIVQSLAGPWRARAGSKARTPTAKDYLRAAMEEEEGRR